MNSHKQQILEHYKHPKNFGKPEEFSHSGEADNLSCGDAIQLFLEVQNDIITTAKFTGDGCSIALATASMLTEELQGKTVDEVKSWDEDKTFDLLKLELTSSRQKCAQLSWNALQHALSF